MDKRRFILTLVAFLSIAQLETVALLCGINGLTLKASFTAVGALGALVIRSLVKGKKDNG